MEFILGKIINDIRELVKGNFVTLNISSLFTKYDVNHGGSLDVNEFGALIKKFAPGMK